MLRPKQQHVRVDPTGSAESFFQRLLDKLQSRQVELNGQPPGGLLSIPVRHTGQHLVTGEPILEARPLCPVGYTVGTASKPVILAHIRTALDDKSTCGCHARNIHPPFSIIGGHGSGWQAIMKQYVYAVLSLWMTVAALKAGSAQAQTANVQVGPRPYYLVEQMAPSKLKQRLAACAETRPAPSDFSIAHRGAPLQFPEHSLEGYRAAARMGAGILECDVTFTADGELVCRHAQCDLHATTDILQRPELRSKCHVAPQLAADLSLIHI